MSLFFQFYPVPISKIGITVSLIIYIEVSGKTILFYFLKCCFLLMIYRETDIIMGTDWRLKRCRCLHSRGTAGCGVCVCVCVGFFFFFLGGGTLTNVTFVWGSCCVLFNHLLWQKSLLFFFSDSIWLWKPEGVWISSFSSYITCHKCTQKEVSCRHQEFFSWVEFQRCPTFSVLEASRVK